ncbi:hypothetical protein ACJJTC_009442 [Scirpophaga incertulas]
MDGIEILSKCFSAYTLSECKCSGIFSAICNSGIVFDGGILIDHEFKTSDPFIYAAGPATRYCRRYYAEKFRQKYYDSNEIGAKLASEIRNHLDPLFTGVTGKPNKSKCRFTAVNDTKEPVPALPVLRKPLTIHCTMPGGLQYLEVRSPGLKIPNLYVSTLEFNGCVYETFKGGYFKLHLTNEHIVDGITCLTPERKCLKSFKNLYGLSTVVLNNLHLRFTTTRLDNLYEFFSSPWAFFLYHEQCEELFAMTKQLKPKGNRHGATLEESLRAMGELLSASSSRFSTKMKLKSTFEQSRHVEAIMEYVMEWLTENDLKLPMYFEPAQQLDYGYGLGKHPAFKKKKTELVKLFHALY